MNELVEKLLAAYKELNGIAIDDTSQDAVLSLYLELAIEVAKEKACDIKDWNYEKLPKAVVMGMLMYVDLFSKRNENYGIKSESIDGMSQTYIDNAGDDSYFNPVYDLFALHCTTASGYCSAVFRNAKRGG